jgi:hypothetical protein
MKGLPDLYCGISISALATRAGLSGEAAFRESITASIETYSS